jgi:hypothetical protein
MAGSKAVESGCGAVSCIFPGGSYSCRLALDGRSRQFRSQAQNSDQSSIAGEACNAKFPLTLKAALFRFCMSMGIALRIPRSCRPPFRFDPGRRSELPRPAFRLIPGHLPWDEEPDRWAILAAAFEPGGMDADEEAKDARCARSIEIAPGRLCPDARGRPNDGRCAFYGAGHGAGGDRPQNRRDPRFASVRCGAGRFEPVVRVRDQAPRSSPIGSRVTMLPSPSSAALRSRWCPTTPRSR